MGVVKTCFGIYREPAHSPGRVEDDRAILQAVAQALQARGFSVDLVAPDAEFDTHFANVFAMCERTAVLQRLSAAEKTGSIVVNSPEAIRNTYRHRMDEIVPPEIEDTPIPRFLKFQSRQLSVAPINDRMHKEQQGSWCLPVPM